MLRLFLISGLLASAIAGADTTASDPLPGTVERDPPYAEGPSPAAAYGWSLGGIFLPMAAGFAAIGLDAKATTGVLLGTGLLAGPSFGQFHAGSYGRGALAMGIRGAGVAAMLAGFADEVFGCGNGDVDANQPDTGEDCSQWQGWPLVLGGGALWIGGVVYSFLDIRPAVERRQKRVEAGARTSRLRLVPSLRMAHGVPAFGGVARLTF